MADEQKRAVQTLSWTVHEFEKKDRHPDWIWTVGLIAVAVSILAFFYGNIFFGIFAVIAGGVVIFFALREPREVTIVLTADALIVDDHTIPYTKIEKFWLDETAKPDKLLLATKTGFIPVITLSLDGVSAEAVRQHLKQYCPEEQILSSVSSKIFDRLGF